MAYNSFRPGKKWLDTNGKPIQAHGFSVFYDEKTEEYYWFGENKEKTKGGPFNTVWHWGVRCYSSKDLYNWEDRGLIIPPHPDNLNSPLHPKHFKGMLPPYTREAPTYFMRNEKKYLFTSGTSMYYPNPRSVACFTDFHGEYTDLGDPHIGDKSNTSFHSQITCVLKVPGKDSYIAMADRWKPGIIDRHMSPVAIKGVQLFFKDYVPDESPREAEPVSGKLGKHSENTSKARYVWLPIEWEGDKPVIRWHDEWRIEDYS